MRKITWFLFFLVFAVSCLDEPECFLLNNNNIGVFFRVIGSNRLDSLGVKSVFINGGPLVSSRGGIFDKSKDSIVTNVQIPLDYFNRQTTLDFGIGEANRRMIVDYQVQVQYVSEDCGPRYILSELNASQAVFDSIRFVNRTPSRDGSGRHIEVFRCPRTDSLTLTLYQLTLPAPSAATPSPANRSRPVGANINAITVDNATLIHENSRKTTIHLPVNLNATTTTYSFDFASDFGFDDPVRELTVNYTATNEDRYPGFCAPATYVTDLNIPEVALTSAFDSVSIVRDANGFPKSTLTDPFETNINVYRCPPTNLAQIGFVRQVGEATQGASVALLNITADYTPAIFYPDTTVSFVQLPLDLSKNSTVFTFNFEDRTETITINYQLSPPPSSLFPGNACRNRNIIGSITIAGSLANVLVPNNTIAFPAIRNINIVVP